MSNVQVGVTTMGNFVIAVKDSETGNVSSAVLSRDFMIRLVESIVDELERSSVDNNVIN